MQILLVDDDNFAREAIANFLVTALDHQIVQAENGKDALVLFEQEEFPIVITDIRMPGMSGLELLKSIKSTPKGRASCVVLVTGFSDLNSAVFALREGAFDYLSKPIDVMELAGVINRWEATNLKIHDDSFNVAKTIKKSVHSSLADFKLENSVFREVSGVGKVGLFSDALKTAVILALRFHDDRNVPVLIEGETGTGKEVLARVVHQGNMTEPPPFISVNCSALSPSLIESELFGYESGSFTGANSKGSKGKLELAQGSTLFLDEIGEMPMELQPKLLRALQEREIYRIGGQKPIKLDVRFIAATNRDLLKCTQDGTFRKDLYYRLNLGRIYLPPLREQRESIVPLAHLYLIQFSAEKKRRFRFIEKEAMRTLEEYDWPGNVRELRNTIERITVFYDEFELRAEHLDFLGQLDQPAPKDSGSVLKLGQIVLPPDKLNLQDVENEIVTKAMEMFSNNQTRAAEYLGLSRHALRTRLNRN